MGYVLIRVSGLSLGLGCRKLALRSALLQSLSLHVSGDML